MVGRRNPSARRAAGASEGVIAGRRDSQKFNSTRTEKQVGETAIYLGMAYLGRVVPVRGKYQARDADDRLLNTLPTVKAATSAVYSAGGAR